MLTGMIGNRIWGKDLNMNLQLVEWSPDNKDILFVSSESDVWIYTSDGDRVRMLSLPAASSSSSNSKDAKGSYRYVFM